MRTAFPSLILSSSFPLSFIACGGSQPAGGTHSNVHGELQPRTRPLPSLLQPYCCPWGSCVCPPPPTPQQKVVIHTSDGVIIGPPDLIQYQKWSHLKDQFMASQMDPPFFNFVKCFPAAVSIYIWTAQFDTRHLSACEPYPGHSHLCCLICFGVKWLWVIKNCEVGCNWSSKP